MVTNYEVMFPRLEMFEDFAVERLRVLRTLEKHNMGGKTKFSEDWVDDIWRDLEKNGLVHYLQLGERQHGTEKVGKIDMSRFQEEE